MCFTYIFIIITIAILTMNITLVTIRQHQHFNCSSTLSSASISELVSLTITKVLDYFVRAQRSNVASQRAEVTPRYSVSITE